MELHDTTRNAHNTSSVNVILGRALTPRDGVRGHKPGMNSSTSGERTPWHTAVIVTRSATNRASRWLYPVRRAARISTDPTSAVPGRP